MRSIIAAALLLCASAASASSATNAPVVYYWDWLTQYKKPNLHWGQLQFHPFYRLSKSYETNIYLVPKPQNGYSVGGGVRGSFIMRNNLGIELFLPVGRRHEFAAGYMSEFQNYTTQPEINNAINQGAKFDYKYKGSHGLTFTAGNRYINTNDQAFSQIIERQRRWENRVFAALDYAPEGNRMTAGVDASHMTNKYVGGIFARDLNRYEQSAGFTLGYRVQPKTRVYASYHRGIIHYTVGRQQPNQDKNNKSHDFAGGVTGDLTAKLKGQVEGGVTYREYDEAPIGGVTRITRNFTVSTNLTYAPTDRTTVLFSATRLLQESISGSNRFYINNNATLDIKHRLPYKFTVGVNGAFGLDKYPDTQVASTGRRGERRDDIYQGGAWVEYDIQSWLSTGIAYVYRERNSTFTGEFNYEDQVTTWNLALKF
jgi:hypothetical protein